MKKDSSQKLRPKKPSCLAQPGSDISSDGQSQYEMMETRIRYLEQRKKLDKLKKKKKLINVGDWSLQQNLKYKQFLQKNAALFETDTNYRRVIKINVQISNAIGTRSSNQCRSYHQKMMGKFKSISGIIHYIEQKNHQQKIEVIQTCQKVAEKNEVALLDLTDLAFDNLLPELDAFNFIYEEQRVFNQPDLIDDIIWYDGERIW